MKLVLKFRLLTTKTTRVIKQNWQNIEHSKVFVISSKMLEIILNFNVI